MVVKHKANVSEVKKAKVKELAELMKKKTVMIISIKGLPSAQFQEIKKKLRSKAKVQMVKKSLVNFALDHSSIKELHDLVKFVDDGTAILFSDSDAFEIAGILASEKSPAKAKAGQVAPHDIEVKAGPTELLPGPDISALSAVGLAPKVEGGKIAIMQDKVIVKEGQKRVNLCIDIFIFLHCGLPQKRNLPNTDSRGTDYYYYVACCHNLLKSK